MIMSETQVKFQLEIVRSKIVEPMELDLRTNGNVKTMNMRWHDTK